MPVQPQDDDQVRSRLRDPVYARAYEAWLEIVIERASRAHPRRRPHPKRVAGVEVDRTTLAS